MDHSDGSGSLTGKKRSFVKLARYSRLYLINETQLHQRLLWTAFIRTKLN
jgi:hypothetical protein